MPFLFWSDKNFYQEKNREKRWKEYSVWQFEFVFKLLNLIFFYWKRFFNGDGSGSGWEVRRTFECWSNSLMMMLLLMTVMINSGIYFKTFYRLCIGKGIAFESCQNKLFHCKNKNGIKSFGIILFRIFVHVCVCVCWVLANCSSVGSILLNKKWSYLKWWLFNLYLWWFSCTWTNIVYHCFGVLFDYLALFFSRFLLVSCSYFMMMFKLFLVHWFIGSVPSRDFFGSIYLDQKWKWFGKYSCCSYGLCLDR